MKNLIVIMLVVLSVTVSHAQVNQGAWLLGASSALNYTSYSYKDGTSASSFNLNARTGYFVVKGLAVGINLGFLSLSQSGGGSSSSTESITQIGAFTRYYFPFNLFLGAGINSTSTSFSGGGSTSSSTSIPFEAGYAAFITRNIAVEPSLTYMVGDAKGPQSTIALNVGFMIFLNRNLPGDK